MRKGDRLDADEFMRRYEAMPDVTVELIEGVVYMPAPVTADLHGKPHHRITGWLWYYSAFTPGTEGANDATVELDLGNVPQPDVFMHSATSHGGQSTITRKGYTAGPPELVVEVAGKSKEARIRDKQEAYRRNGVREFLIWRVPKQEIKWLTLQRGRYVRLKPSAGIYKSRAFPGLWLDAAAFLRNDMVQVIGVVQQGLATPEHAAFGTMLQQAYTSGDNA